MNSVNPLSSYKIVTEFLEAQKIPFKHFIDGYFQIIRDIQGFIDQEVYNNFHGIGQGIKESKRNEEHEVVEISSEQKTILKNLCFLVVKDSIAFDWMKNLGEKIKVDIDETKISIQNIIDLIRTHIITKKTTQRELEFIFGLIGEKGIKTFLFEILKHEDYYQSNFNNFNELLAKCFTNACERGFGEVLERLMQFKAYTQGAISETYFTEALQNAVDNHQDRIVETLTKDKTFNEKIKLKDLKRIYVNLEKESEDIQVRNIKTYIRSSASFTAFLRTLRLQSLIEEGLQKEALEKIEEDQFVGHVDFDTCFDIAAKRGYVNICKRLLEKNKVRENVFKKTFLWAISESEIKPFARGFEKEIFFIENANTYFKEAVEQDLQYAAINLLEMKPDLESDAFLKCFEKVMTLWNIENFDLKLLNFLYSKINDGKEIQNIYKRSKNTFYKKQIKAVSENLFEECKQMKKDNIEGIKAKLQKLLKSDLENFLIWEIICLRRKEGEEYIRDINRLNEIDEGCYFAAYISIVFAKDFYISLKNLFVNWINNLIVVKYTKKSVNTISKSFRWIKNIFRKIFSKK